MRPLPPWTDSGMIQSEVSSLKDEVRRKADDWKISEINRRVDSLEYTNREIRTLCDELLSRLQTVEENYQEIKRELETGRLIKDSPNGN